jgi:hypothetical protein
MTGWGKATGRCGSAVADGKGLGISQLRLSREDWQRIYGGACHAADRRKAT